MATRYPYLQALEDEAIYILRETAAQFERPALLFSGGKDSICVVHLARKAFFPGRIPFPLVHIDTGHNFQETLDYRDALVARLGADLVVGSVQQSIDQGKVQEETGKHASRNALQTVTLLDTIAANKYDACIGGARRDEEKARAKERIFSVRDDFGQWNPKLQRPEPWLLLNGLIQPGENVRVFPISNWTELDVWRYIQQEEIPLPSLYFAHTRQVVARDGILLPHSPYLNLVPEDEIRTESVRFRTIGDMTCTAAVPSTATALEDVISEIMASEISERGARMDDKRAETAMENRKLAGYF